MAEWIHKHVDRIVASLGIEHTRAIHDGIYDGIMDALFDRDCEGKALPVRPAAEEQRPPAPPPGLASIVGKWPGDETEAELIEAMKASATARAYDALPEGSSLVKTEYMRAVEKVVEAAKAWSMVLCECDRIDNCGPCDRLLAALAVLDAIRAGQGEGKA